MGWHNMKPNIKDVAIYLRKSRDDSDGQEDVLAKHESLLLNMQRVIILSIKFIKKLEVLNILIGDRRWCVC